MRILTYAALIALAGAATLGAQERQPDSAPNDQEPTFRSAVDLAQVDVIVTDEDGNPVTDLTAADFELLENDEPRDITTFEAIALPIPDPLGAAPAGLAEPDVASNGRLPDRVYMFALDEVAPCNALRTRHFLRQFLDQYFGPNDVAAVALVGRGLATDGQDFTANRRLLLAAIDKFSGGFDPGCPGRHTPPDSKYGGRSQQLASLRTLTDTLARIPARRKAMLLFTQTLDLNMFDIVDYNGGVLGLAGEDAHAVLRAATRANITIYPIDPTGLTPDHIPLETLAAMTALGHATGGFALYNSNSFLQTFDRIVRENSTYYLLGYDSAYGRDDGRYVRVKVNVTRPGLKVHARDGYVAASRDERQAEADADASLDGSPVALALATPLSTPGVGVRAFAAPFRGTGKHARVQIVADIDTRTLGLAEQDGGRAGGRLEVGVVATAHRDKSYPVSRYATMLDVDPAQPGGPAPLVRAVSTLDLPPGRYQLRIAGGTDARAGSAVLDLEVPDFGRRPLAMSGLAVRRRGTEPVLAFRAVAGDSPDGPKRCRPPFCPADYAGETGRLVEWSAARSDAEPQDAIPTTAREFARDDTLELYAEIYDNRKRREQQEPPPIELTFELRNAQGDVIQTVREARDATEPDVPHALTVPVPLEGLAHGTYVLEVRATTTDGERAISRRVAISVGEPAP